MGGGQVPFDVSNLVDQEQPSWNELLAVLLQLMQNQQQMTGTGGAGDGSAFPLSPGSFGGGGGGAPSFGSGSSGPLTPFLGGSPAVGGSPFAGSPIAGSPIGGGSSPVFGGGSPSYGGAPAVASGAAAPVGAGPARGSISDVAPPALGAGEAARASAVISDTNPNMKVGQFSIRDPQTGELHNFEFRNGGFGRGHIPDGTYIVDNGRRRSDVSSMMVGGYGYSFDLTQEGRPQGTAQDPRYGNDRSLLRVHPDGGAQGTLGCIGIVGDRATQERFYDLAQRAAEANGGSFRLEFGAPQAERSAENEAAAAPETAAENEAADGAATDSRQTRETASASEPSSTSSSTGSSASSSTTDSTSSSATSSSTSSSSSSSSSSSGGGSSSSSDDK